MSVLNALFLPRQTTKPRVDAWNLGRLGRRTQKSSRQTMTWASIGPGQDFGDPLFQVPNTLTHVFQLASVEQNEF